MSAESAEGPDAPSRDDPPRQSRVSGQILAQISTELVQLHRRYYGKGPTKAKTYMVNDTVVCMLRDGFTAVEKTLIDQGQGEAVYAMRRSFQDAMEEQFRAVVERATGRTVIAYLSQAHFDPDIAVELFVLEPASQPLMGQHEEDFRE